MIQMEQRYAAKENHGPVYRPCLYPRVSSKRSFSDCSLDSDADCMKKQGRFCHNLLGNSKSSADLCQYGSMGFPFKEDNDAEYRICGKVRCKYLNYSELVCPQVLNSNDYTSPASSVDSCGGVSCNEDSEALSSDADSFSCLRKDRRKFNLSLQAGVNSDAKILHRSELKSYRRTLEELYACGPLSWEQQEYLADLRSMLHISNDEHLSELLAQLLKLVRRTT